MTSIPVTVSSGAEAAPESLLDNPVLHSLMGRHRRLALLSGPVGRYPGDVSPFMALPDDASGEDWDALARLADGDPVTVMNAPEAPRGWTVRRDFPVLQMVGSETMRAGQAGAVVGGLRLEPLYDDDAPAMLALARRTEPGPFAEGSHKLGAFFGAWEDGVLVAMAGERLQPDGWTEISAVCTDESHRGRGLGRALMEQVIRGIQERGETPFLHVVPENTNAIRLYERMGFTVRRTCRVTSFQPG